MKRRPNLLIALVVLAAIAIGWWLTRSAPPSAPPVAKVEEKPPPTTVHSTPPKVVPPSVPRATVPLPPEFPAQSQKVAAMQAIWKAENAQPQDFYGRAIDQHGQPIPGATATGTLMEIQGYDVGEKQSIVTTTTDGQGNFQFVGLHGWKLAVWVEKPGYQALQLPGVYRGPTAEQRTTPENRGIFTLWKLAGPERMVHASIADFVPCDGTMVRYDLFSGQRISSGGDLIVRLTRNPVAIDIRQPFDWSISLEFPDGGVQAIADIYPNEAPRDGYDSKWTYSNNAVGKTTNIAFLTKSFYFRIRHGGIYGRVAIRVVADFQPPPTSFEAEIFVNPGGSRNLEFDSTQSSGNH